MYSSCAIGIVLVLASSALGAADSTAGVVIRAAGGITATAHGQLRSIHSADRLYAREVLNLSPESRAVIALANGARYQPNGRSKIQINSFGIHRLSGRNPRALEKLDARFLRNLVSKSQIVGTTGGDIARGLKEKYSPIGTVRPGPITLVWEGEDAAEPLLYVWSAAGIEKLKKSLAPGASSFAMPEEYGQAGSTFTWTVVVGSHAAQGGLVNIPSAEAMSNLLALENAAQSPATSKEERIQLMLLLEYNYRSLGFLDSAIEAGRKLEQLMLSNYEFILSNIFLNSAGVADIASSAKPYAIC